MAVTKKFYRTDMNGVTIEVNLGAEGENVTIDGQKLTDLLDGKAPKNHASSATTYGAGNSANYGHVKLSDSTNSTSGVTDGTAATPAAVKAVYDSLSDKCFKSGSVTYTGDILNSTVLDGYMDNGGYMLRKSDGDSCMYLFVSSQYRSYDADENMEFKTIVYSVSQWLLLDNHMYYRSGSVQETVRSEDSSQYDEEYMQTLLEWTEDWSLMKNTPVSHASASPTYGAGTSLDYGHVKLSDSTSSTSGTSDGTAATPAAVKAAYDLANKKANRVNNDGGFAAGLSASTADGGAIGCRAKANYGGGAAGYEAETNYGGSMGNQSVSNYGCAIGYLTKTGDGVAIGKEAKTIDSSNNGIDAIQLGTGTNNTPKTMQVYSYQLMDANGKIPTDRLSSYAQLLSQLADRYNAAIVVDTATTISSGKYQNYTSPFTDYDGETLGVIIYAPNATSIASLSVRDTNHIISIVAPNLKTITGNAFWGVHYLQFMYIPSTVTSIDSTAFQYCEKLYDIYIDKPEDSISGAPWQTLSGAIENIYWLGGA